MKREADHPKYIGVKKHLNELIQSEKLRPGDKIPSENELMDALGVSRNTVRQALGDLVNGGILTKHQGKGTFVKSLLKSGNTRLVGVINHSLLDNIYPDIIWGIETTLSANGYSFILSNSNQDKEREMEALRRMLNQNICGLIIEPVASTNLGNEDPLFRMIAKAGIPVVTTNCMINGLGASSITIDDNDLGYRAARYLIDKGHKRLAVIYKKEVLAGIQRRDGFFKACTEAGIKLPAECDAGFGESDERTHPGYALTTKLMKEKGARPTALFCYNDENALQAMKAARDLGLRVPEDLSILGVDNIREAEMAQPGLTTFDHPKGKLGQWAARIIIDQTENCIVPSPEVMKIQPGIIERQSVGTAD
jgi:GntR family transcriptional regulator of arabinose operon